MVLPLQGPSIDGTSADYLIVRLGDRASLPPKHEFYKDLHSSLLQKNDGEELWFCIYACALYCTCISDNLDDNIHNSGLHSVQTT